jgi:DNA polymerase III epsilon subunit-like protein
MRLLGLDFETTGLDLANDRITEVGLALWDVDTKRPLVTYGQFLIDDGIRARLNPDTVAMMERVSGISPSLLEEFGMCPIKLFSWLDTFCFEHGVDYICAHNGNGYDKPLLAAELKRHGVPTRMVDKIHWLDSRVDIPHPSPPDSNKLKHLALDAGFINPFAHRAVFDVLTMLRVLSHYDLNEVVRYSRIPSVVIRAVVPHPKQDGGKGKDRAKAAGFRWREVDYKVYENCWVKKIRVDQLEAERAKLPGIQIVVLS